MLATNKKRPPNGDLLVGMTGFEPATTRPPGVYSTGLSYIPKNCRTNGIRTCDLHDVNVAL